MVIKTLANQVRNDSTIKEIIIDIIEIKISLLTDDATCILSDLLSLKMYKLCSGCSTLLKINNKH